MVGTLLVANAALVLELMRERGMNPIQLIYLLAIPTNVLIIGVAVIYGDNDAFVAALLIFAVLLRHRGNFLAAGVLVGLAALTKYYPVLLLPFFALDGTRLRWSVIASGMAVFCVGLAAAVAIWGPGPMEAILFGSGRDPKLLSILKALGTLFGDKGTVGWLIRYNTYFVVSGVAPVRLEGEAQLAGRGCPWLLGDAHPLQGRPPAILRPVAFHGRLAALGQQAIGGPHCDHPSARYPDAVGLPIRL